MGWPDNPRPAKSLLTLRRQIGERWPKRSKVSDGLLGDPAHAARGSASDHNPHVKIEGVGVVTAFDITKDDQNGPDAYDLAHALTLDSRAKSVIFNARIWKARTGKWEAYRGANAHKQHVHLSVKPESADDDREWQLDLSENPARPVLKRGARGADVEILQGRLRALGYSVATDGSFGMITESVVKQFQRRAKLEVDGIVGPRTWRELTL